MRDFLIKFFLYLFAFLPLSKVHAIASYIGRILVYFPNSPIAYITRKNITVCYPHLSPQAQQQLIKASLIETCKTFSELGAVWLWSPRRVMSLVRQVSGEGYLKQAIQQGRGVILLTPHLGSWEMAGLYASAHYEITSLYRPPKRTGLSDLIKRGRERIGARLVPTDQAGIRALYQTLKRGEIAGILPDQVPHQEGTGEFAPFFHCPAYTMTLVARFARKNQSPVIFTYAERLPNGEGFHIHFLPAPDDIDSDDIQLAVSALNQGIENCIQHCPSQYQWSYKRFKRLPNGQACIY
ncbi:Lauroyl/myristoyl acyltransferase [Beggiatoa alba B18LD]|uniref:Lauroyl/myristoyl acyltransferase n=1 Tax=Beggiatoa alba B18LD TaxID=395493 RepID=I3CGF6_9GAMM|nr:lysophospholipid acyltransferase family protein [Beggiatoa alba]EIJ42699.1 Lauroyl/myristoyl acyltransferase [Beggiatoa alba B18LD]